MVKVTVQDFKNWFSDDNSSFKWFIVLRLHIHVTHHLRKTPIYFGVKRSTVKVTSEGFRKFISEVITCYSSLQETPIDSGVIRSKVKVTGQGYRKFISQVITCYSSLQENPYWFWGSYGQRSRSPVKVIENSFPKLLPVTHHFRKTPIDSGVIRSKVKVTCEGFRKFISGW